MGGDIVPARGKECEAVRAVMRAERGDECKGCDMSEVAVLSVYEYT